MAPQQNSTFIDDDSHLRTKLHSNPSTRDSENVKEEEEDDEIIERYSPIPKPDDCRLIESDCQDCNKAHEVHEKPKRKEFPQTNRTELQNLHEAPTKKTRQNYYKQHRNGNGYGIGNANYNSHATQSCLSRRSRSVSVHGANSTMEQGQKEITIWIDNEPRYVSGVTKKTTCSDIIKALIDDEIQNGNDAFYKRTKKPNTHTNDGGDGDDDGDGVCATSRDYSDYVITESWRGIERSYDGNMMILPVWKAWSRVHNEFRLRLRHRSDIREPIPSAKPCRRQNFLAKCLKKLTRLWRKEKSEHPQKPTKAMKMKENCLFPNKADPIPDEFLFVILPDKVYEKDRTILQPIQEEQSTSRKHRTRPCSMRPTHAKSKANRKKHERGVSGVNNNSCIRRRQPATVVGNSIRNSVRYRLAQKTSEMDALYAREYALTRELSEKCKQYHLQNQIYSNPDQQWNISIGQVQRKIENYAKEIVRTEHELLELKNEIKQDISLINNLKRMTLERGGDRQKIPKPAPAPTPATTMVSSPIKCSTHSGPEPSQEMQFVDNIYEFCDNNASMLV